MQKNRVCALLLVLAVGVLAGTLGLGAWRSREPSYQGKRLSEWVEGFTIPLRIQQEKDPNAGCPGCHVKGWKPPDQKIAEQKFEAITRIGTNAIPFLIAWMAYETPAWQQKLSDALVRLNPRWALSRRKELRAEGAAIALPILASATDAMIAELAVMMSDSAKPNAANRACSAAVRLGLRAWPAVIGAATNQCLKLHVMPQAWPQYLTSTNPSLRVAATNSLRVLDPKLFETLAKAQ